MESQTQEQFKQSESHLPRKFYLTSSDPVWCIYKAFIQFHIDFKAHDGRVE